MIEIVKRYFQFLILIQEIIAKVMDPSTEEDQLMAIRESWNHFDGEYYSKLVKIDARNNKGCHKKSREVTNSFFSFFAQ